MDITDSLLVVIMFVVLLTMGIGNILTSLASIVNRKSAVTVHRIHLSWIVLLLLAYFNLFWNAVEILQTDEWDFVGFLYIELGPILIFFATQVFLPGEDGIEKGESIERYFSVSRQFFFLLALTQLWVLGADFVLGNGFTEESIVNIISAGLALILASTQRPRVHVVGAYAAWAFVGTEATLRVTGVLG